VLRETARQERRKLADTAGQINDLAMRDGLTGLYNRAHALKLLQAELERAERSGRAFSVALIDLDHFKKVNDTHGHAVGDEVLRHFGAHAVEAMRTIDVVARWGGEEFLVLLPEVADRASAVLAVERLRERICQEALSAGVPGLRVTLSAGVATLQRGEEVAHLLERADRSLYLAKEQGRNRCVYSDPLPRKDAAAAGACYFPAGARCLG
jgi:diguanylate cyclase (GGDEF)-like protein